MYFIMFLSTAVIVYVGTFSSEFKEDDKAKASIFILVCCIILFAISILSSL